jgi:hypothetical protein
MMGHDLLFYGCYSVWLTQKRQGSSAWQSGMGDCNYLYYPLFCWFKASTTSLISTLRVVFLTHGLSSWLLMSGLTINSTGLDWIKHLKKHISTRTEGGYQMLVLDGHESHQSVDFEEFCKVYDIITICLPSHLSHLIQPLNVSSSLLNKRHRARKPGCVSRPTLTTSSRSSSFWHFMRHTML